MSATRVNGRCCLLANEDGVSTQKTQDSSFPLTVPNVVRIPTLCPTLLHLTGARVSSAEVQNPTFCQVRRLLYCIWGLDHVQRRFHVVLRPKPVGSSSHFSHLRRQTTKFADVGLKELKKYM